LDRKTVQHAVVHRPDRYADHALRYRERHGCRICGSQGYYQSGRNVMCKNCASAINIPTVGQQGGCNPIPLASSVQGEQIVIAADNLLAEGSKLFGGSR
jgi:uncharacterized membrane protein